MYRSLSLNTLKEFCIFNEPKVKERCESKQTSVCVVSKIFNLLLYFSDCCCYFCIFLLSIWMNIVAEKIFFDREFMLVALLCSFADFLTIFYGIFKAKGNKNHRNFINCNKSAAEFKKHNKISYCKAGVKSGSHDTFF